MKDHAMIVIKPACTLLFSLCLLAGNEAYALCCDKGEQFEVQTEYDPVDEKYIYTIPICYPFYDTGTNYNYTIGLTLFQVRNEHNTYDLIMQLSIGYFPADWLSADGFLFRADGTKVMERRDIDPERRVLKNDSKHEYYNLPLTSKDDIAAMKKIASSGKTLLRLYGKHNNEDLELTANQKLAMRLMLEKYDELKGKQP